ncbi:MAG: hypothetical protein R2780_09660 [Crocinitomicaceae bacterium]|nr:hypothetical protein [Crocinitomicaceae bacterium]
MKKIIFISILVFLSLGNDCFGQSRTLEQKIKGLHRLETQLFQLPFSQEYITNTVLVEVYNERLTLAPHFPTVSDLERTNEAYTVAFHNWAENYQFELDAYYEFLSNYVRTHKADQ